MVPDDGSPREKAAIFDYNRNLAGCCNTQRHHLNEIKHRAPTFHEFGHVSINLMIFCEDRCTVFKAEDNWLDMI